MKESMKKLVLSFGLTTAVVAVLFLGFWLWSLLPPKSYSAQEIYQMAAPSVVKITVTSRNGAVGVGTGFFYDEKGTVVTTYEVIKDRIAASIKTYDGGEYEVVSVLGYDEARNIAVLDTRCQTSKALSFRPDNQKVKKGEPAYVIGNTFEMESSLSEGVISAAPKKTAKNQQMVTTALIAKEDSGAPLMDQYGNVIGIASFADVKKLNIAVPIWQFGYVQKNSPTLLSELFQPVAASLYDMDFIYDSAKDKFVLLFQVVDQDYVPIQSSGRVQISIKNDDGVNVYIGLSEFDESDYSDMYLDGCDAKTRVALYVDPADMLEGRTPYGTVWVSVITDEVGLFELEFSTHQLPYKKPQAPN